MTQTYQVDGPIARDQRDTAHERGDSDGRPIGVIVTDLWEKTEKLVRQEMRLGLTEAEEKVEALKAELDDRLQTVKVEAAAKAIGGGVAIAGALTLVAAIVLLLAMFMKPWVAALITGAVFTGVGVALLKREVKIPPAPDAGDFVPKRTIESIKADTQAIEEATRGNTK
jgi:hypothetical protein